MQPEQAANYTLHSLKVTMLSWMAQLDLPLPARTLQGHHALAGSMQLYSRDDVWPALRAQLSVWEAIHRGFTPMLPQHRGGQNPLQETLPAMSGFSWTQRTATPSCFVLTSDAQFFLSWQAGRSATGASILGGLRFFCSFGAWEAIAKIALQGSPLRGL